MHIGPTAEAPLKAPLFVLFDVNAVCQLACKYCSAMPFDGTQVPYKRSIELIDEMTALGVVQIVFSGGEPFVHRDFPFMLLHAAENRLRASVNTNAIYFSRRRNVDRYLETLGSYARSVTLNVSLDSPTAVANDTARGRTLDVTAAIENLLEAEVPITLRSVVHRGTLASADELISNYYPRVRYFSFFRILPTAQTAAHPDLLIDAEDFDNFCYRVSKLKARHSDLIVQLPTRTVPADEVGACGQAARFCFCGQTKIHIDARLEVYPCTYSKTPENRLGSLAQHSIETIWRSPQAVAIRTRGYKEALCGRDTLEERPLARYRVDRDDSTAATATSAFNAP